jgi:hypothetical protein
MKRLALTLGVLIAVLAGGFATAVATAGTSSGNATAAQAAGRVQIQLHVTKFVRNGRHLLARGTAIATYTRQDGRPATARQPFTARVAVGGKQTPSAPCPVLTLQIDQLSLDLLGLHVDLSKVVLTITANASEGVLGKLFCQVANANLATGNTATAKLNRVVAHRGGLSTKGVGFGVPARAMQAIGPGPCPIVDLLLGPLHLDLLGLIVDLNQVHLQITAAPDGGILGSLLCQLTGGPSTSTTTTTTTTAAASP